MGAQLVPFEPPARYSGLVAPATCPVTGVTISEGVLYQARFYLPSNVTTGTYTAETFAISNGRVIASAIAEVEVKKVGFERFVEQFSRRQAFWYGLLAVSLSVFMGWLAGRVFALI